MPVAKEENIQLEKILIMNSQILTNIGITAPSGLFMLHVTSFLLAMLELQKKEKKIIIISIEIDVPYLAQNIAKG
jgi:hypothetical protein